MSSVRSTESETERLAVEPTLPSVQQLTALAAQPRFAGQPCEAALSQALAMWKKASELVRKEAVLNQLIVAHYVEPMRELRKPEEWPASFDTFLKYVVRSDRDDIRFPRFRRFLLHEIRLEAHSKAAVAARVQHGAEAQQVAGAKAEVVTKAIGQGRSAAEAVNQSKAEVVDACKNYQPAKLDVRTLGDPQSDSERVAVERQFEFYRESSFNETLWDSLALRYLQWWKDHSHRSKSRAGAKGASAKKTNRRAPATTSL